MSLSRFIDNVGMGWIQGLITALPRNCLVILGIGFLGLSACNYTPAFAPGGAGEGLKGSVIMEEPRDRNDYTFATRLEERLGRPRNARFRLKYSISTSTEGVGRTPTQRITRFNVTGTAEYQVLDTVAGTVVHSGKVENLTGYSGTIPLTSARVATRDASDRLMVILADQVAVRVLASYRDWSG